jgi:CDGSH-type Zn-finger protein
MSEAIIAQRSPYGIDVEEGKTYWWCTCGRSAKQPFCDGSHKVTSMAPLKYTADKSGKVWFCGCKQTASQPLCDGAHNKIPKA